MHESGGELIFSGALSNRSSKPVFKEIGPSESFDRTPLLHAWCSACVHQQYLSCRLFAGVCTGNQGYVHKTMSDKTLVAGWRLFVFRSFHLFQSLPRGINVQTHGANCKAVAGAGGIPRGRLCFYGLEAGLPYCGLFGASFLLSVDNSFIRNLMTLALFSFSFSFEFFVISQMFCIINAFLFFKRQFLAFEHGEQFENVSTFWRTEI